MRRITRTFGVDLGADASPPPDLRAELRRLADLPEEGLLWSDLASHARNAFLQTRRRLAGRHAPAAR